MYHFLCTILKGGGLRKNSFSWFEKIEGLSSCGIFKSIMIISGWLDKETFSPPCYIYIYTYIYIYIYTHTHIYIHTHHAHISLQWKKKLFILKKLLCQEGSSKRNFVTQRQAIGYSSDPETWLCTRLTWGHVKLNPRPHPRAADSLDLRWSPGICIPGVLPGAAGVAGFGTPLATSAPWLLCGDCPLTVAVFSPSLAYSKGLWEPSTEEGSRRPGDRCWGPSELCLTPFVSLSSHFTLHSHSP